MDKRLMGIVCAIISMVSVVIFFIWGWIEGTYSHAWIIFMVSGISCAAVSMIGGYKQEKKDEESKNE
ncbi:MAG: hypothetical protein K5639_04210 [Eubacterium sp.]|nr:hypothetical protein [Eubacterium sp.]